ncbi:MAG TPA: hypothetical protein PK408_03180 [Treponemataceae bacterium]|jgi:hypothetical protein|nr:hypothetical protein [Treponemataceae bacterium]
MDPLLLIAVLLFILNLVLMPIFYARLKTVFSPQKILANLKTEVDNLVADIGRETDRDVAILENRIVALRTLIDEADRRVGLARRETEKKSREALILDALSETSPKPAVTEVSPGYSDFRKPDKPNFDKFPETGAPEPAISAPEPAISAPEPAISAVHVYNRNSFVRRPVPIQPSVPVHEKVIDLARKGLSAEFIASTLSLSQGEVELIININSSSL